MVIFHFLDGTILEVPSDLTYEQINIMINKGAIWFFDNNSKKMINLSNVKYFEVLEAK